MYKRQALLYAENDTIKNSSKVSELLNNSLRMRPDRIIMGEIRKENAFIFSRAINTGHQGTIATIHANSADEALPAIIENSILNGDIAEEAVNILAKQLVRRISAVVQLERKNGRVAGYYQEVGEVLRL